jgi:hypothetical protein
MEKSGSGFKIFRLLDAKLDPSPRNTARYRSTETGSRLSEAGMTVPFSHGGSPLVGGDHPAAWL